MRDYTLTYRGEGAFNILFLRKHLVEQMEHISLCRHDETHAVIVELIDHLHKTVQNVRLRHISDNHRVECIRNVLIIVGSAILWVHHLQQCNIIANLRKRDATNTVDSSRNSYLSCRRKGQIPRNCSLRTQLREITVYGKCKIDRSHNTLSAAGPQGVITTSSTGWARDLR